MIVLQGKRQSGNKLRKETCKQQRKELVSGFVICLCVLIFIVIGNYTNNNFLF